MKVALIGANGKVGREIRDELVARGHRVTAISRHPEANSGMEGVTAVYSDINADPDLESKLRGNDAVMSSVRFIEFDHPRLIKAVQASGVRRYLAVGGAGTLRHPDGQLVYLRPQFPEPARENSRLGGEFLKLLQISGLDWTFLSPANKFYDGPKTGKYRLGLDELIIADNGESSVSFKDFATAFADELETPKHTGRRFAVGY